MKSWRDIPGWFSFSWLYDQAIDEANDGDTIAEVGCWLGRSVCYLGQRVRESGKTIRVVSVDWGLGSVHGKDYSVHKPVVQEHGGTIAGVLAANIRACGLTEIVTQIVAPSVQAAELFTNESLAFCFIDAGHDHSSVAADITAWFPKVRIGGLLAGHDYGNGWPGVIRAVNERFGDRDHTLKPHVWGVRK